MKRTIIFVALAMATVGCKARERGTAEFDKANTPTDTPAERATNPTTDTTPEERAVDNTGKNERDRDMDTRTPEDQDGEMDREITQAVRKGVVDEYGVTTSAANVKIVTVDGVVTLRGPVDSESEKKAIGTIAEQVERVKRVDNQLEVASQ